MSLILDALNKADNEENQTEVPSYGSDHDFGPESSLPSSDNKRFYLILVLCAVFATALTLILTMTLSKDKELAQQTQSQSNQTLAITQTTAAAPQTASTSEKQSQPSPAEQWQNTGPAVTQPSTSTKNTVSRPTKLTSIKKTTVNAPSNSTVNNSTAINGSANNSTTNNSSIGPNTQTATDQQTNHSQAISSAKTIDTEKRKALIAAQYESTSKETQTTPEPSSNEKAPSAETANENNDAISAIYQNIEQENNDETLANSQEQGSRPTQHSEVSERANPYVATNTANVARAPVSTPAAKVDNSLSKYPNLNFLNDLPLSTQKQIPTIMYTVHNYSESSATVTLNKKQRRVGEQIATGVTLDEILEDGIVLKYNSTRFKMMALNSWINM